MILTDLEFSYRLLKSTITVGLIIFCVGMTATMARAEIKYVTTGSTYLENFNNIGMTAENLTHFVFENDKTVPGWFSTTKSIIRRTSGTVTPGQYSMGQNETQGSLSFAGDGEPPIWGLKILNATGRPLTEFTLGYIGELWRDSSDKPVPTIAFQWGVFAQDGDNLKTTEGYNSELRLNYAPEDRSDSFQATFKTPPITTRVAGTVKDIHWLPGQYLWLRWLPEKTDYRQVAITGVSFTASAK